MQYVCCVCGSMYDPESRAEVLFMRDIRTGEICPVKKIGYNKKTLKTCPNCTKAIAMITIERDGKYEIVGEGFKYEDDADGAENIR